MGDPEGQAAMINDLQGQGQPQEMPEGEIEFDEDVEDDIIRTDN
jgi:hypothetical protein